MSAIVPSPPIQQINTNLNVPGGTNPLGKLFGGLSRAYGGYQLFNPGSSMTDRMLGAASMANPLLGGALSIGAGLGQAYKDSAPESDFVSGRGSGAQALVGKDQRRKNTKAISETMAPVRELLGTKDLSTAGRDTAPPTPAPGIEQKGTNMGGTVASVAPTPAPAPARTPQSDDMDENFKIWAKANPTLAKKLKEGDYGYEAVQSVINPESTQSGMKAAAALKDKYVDMFKGGGVSFDDAKDVPTGFASPDIKSNLPKDFFNQAAVNADFKQIAGLSGNAQQPKGNASFDQIPDFPSSGNQAPMSLPSGVNLYDQAAVNTNFAPIPGIAQNSYQSYEDWSRSNTNPAEVGEKKVVFPANRRNLVGEDGTLDTGLEDISDAPTIMGPNGVPVLDLQSYYKR